MRRLPRQHAVSAAVLVALGLCAAPLTAAAQSADRQPAACFKRADLIDYLAHQFKETPSIVALTDAGMLLEVFSSKQGATWTMAVTTPAGLTCLMATGQDWQSVPRLADPGPPA